MRKKRQIFIFQNSLLTPDRDTGSKRMYNIIRILRKNFDITFFSWSDEVLNFRDRKKYKNILINQGVRVIDKSSKRNCIDEIKHVARERGNPDYAIISRPEVASFYIPFLKDIFGNNVEIIFDTVDICHLSKLSEINYLKSKSNNEKVIEQKRKQYFMYKSLESYLVDLTDKVWVVKKEEKEHLVKNLNCDPSKIDTVPVFYDQSTTSTPYSERSGMFFLGGFSHEPNVEAIKYYADEILPEVKRRNLDIKLYVVGQRPERLGDIKDEMIQIEGFVEDVEPYFEKCLFGLFPLVTGAGHKGKIVHSLGAGLPVITTSMGISGFNEACDYMLVADNPRDIVDSIERYLNSPDIWEKNRKKGLEYFEKRTSMSTGRKILEEIFSN